jgi:hypothetical protein
MFSEFIADMVPAIEEKTLNFHYDFEEEFGMPDYCKRMPEQAL